MPVSRTTCPHCGRPQYFPNVDLAESSAEAAKLDERHQQALTSAEERKCAGVFADFEEACRKSLAVFACTLERLHRQISSGTEVFETYYKLEELRLSTPTTGGVDWARKRPQAEIELLGTHLHVDQLHYANLSLDGSGLKGYGDCVVQLDELMIAHRASCLEGNSGVIFAVDGDLSKYIRSNWGNRHQLCSAARHALLQPNTPAQEFASILVRSEPDKEDDEFIEVQIFGDMTARTLKSILLTKQTLNRTDRVYWNAVSDKAASFQVDARQINHACSSMPS